MNFYFLFGFHIFKHFTVTFMCQLYLKTSLNLITELDLRFYFKSDKILKNFYKEYIFNVIYMNIFNN